MRGLPCAHSHCGDDRFGRGVWVCRCRAQQGRAVGEAARRALAQGRVRWVDCACLCHPVRDPVRRLGIRDSDCHGGVRVRDCDRDRERVREPMRAEPGACELAYGCRLFEDADGAPKGGE